MLSKKDISTEKKKSFLLDELHKIIAASFSIDKAKFKKFNLSDLGKRLDAARKISWLRQKSTKRYSR